MRVVYIKPRDIAVAALVTAVCLTVVLRLVGIW